MPAMKIETVYFPRKMNHNVKAKRVKQFRRQEITVWHILSINMQMIFKKH